MRMWMLDPKILCRKHLLGEHSELHKFLPSWRKKHSIEGRVDGNAIEPGAYTDRHEVLAQEMINRGYKHQSPLEKPDFSYLPVEHRLAKVDQHKALQTLLDRCPECKERWKNVTKENQKEKETC
jgi:hypothetical protein